MPSIKVYIKKISSKSDFKLPNYETKGAAGMDLSADIESEVILKPLERSLIPTGIAISSTARIRGPSKTKIWSFSLRMVLQSLTPRELLIVTTEGKFLLCLSIIVKLIFKLSVV